MPITVKDLTIVPASTDTEVNFNVVLAARLAHYAQQFLLPRTILEPDTSEILHVVLSARTLWELPHWA